MVLCFFSKYFIQYCNFTHNGRPLPVGKASWRAVYDAAIITRVSGRESGVTTAGGDDIALCIGNAHSTCAILRTDLYDEDFWMGR
jgi:hypothetical protein